MSAFVITCQALLRGVATLGGVIVVNAAVDAISGESDGANIGGGLLLLAVLFLVPLVWGWIDAARHGWLHAVVVWVAALVVLAAGDALRHLVTSEDAGLDRLLSVLSGTLGTAAVGAALGLAFGSAVHSLRLQRS